MKRSREFLFAAAALLLCVLLLCVKVTGGAWHTGFGIVLTILCTRHACSHIARWKYKEKKIQAVDVVLMAAMLLMFFTGMLMHPLQSIFFTKVFHKLSAVVFLLSVAGHVIQHKSYDQKTPQQDKPEKEVHDVS